jgi:hypothetical protein
MKLTVQPVTRNVRKAFSTAFTDCRLRITNCFFFICLLTSSANAGQNDFGIWGSASVKHKFSQKISATLEEQFRFNQNATAVAQYFTDAGVEYSLSKKLKVTLCYRFINNQKETYFSKRHRFYVDLSYKLKYSQLQFLLRTRLQEQQEDIHSSDFGYIPAWYSRNKLTVKFDLNKKYTPYLGVEAFYMISTPNVDGSFIDKMRYTAGFEYEFNRVHALDLFYLMQQDQNVNKRVTDFVAGIGYAYTF